MTEIIGLVGGSSSIELISSIQNRGYKVAAIHHNDMNLISGAELRLKENSDNIEKIYTWFKENNVTNVVIGSGYIDNILLAKHLKSNGLHVNINPDFSLLSKNKFKFKKIIEEKGFKTPQYHLLNIDKNTTISDFKLKYPFVIKPVHDEYWPVKINNKNELENFLEFNNIFTQVVIEEYITGVVITVPITADNRNMQALDVLYYNKAKDRQLKNFHNEVTLKDIGSEAERRLLEDMSQLIKHTDFRGVGRIDLIYKDETAFILEFNSVIVSSRNKINATYKVFKEKGIKISDEIVNNALLQWSQS